METEISKEKSTLSTVPSNWEYHEREASYLGVTEAPSLYWKGLKGGGVGDDNHLSLCQ